MNIQKVYRICNDYQFFTCGSCEQYAKMFELVESDQCIPIIATAIWLCSENYTLDKITEILIQESPEF